MYEFHCVMAPVDFPPGSASKESACNAGDLGSIPGLGRSSGEGNGNLLQHSCLVNPIDRGTLQATAHGVAELDTTEELHFSLCMVPIYVYLFFNQIKEPTTRNRGILLQGVTQKWSWNGNSFLWITEPEDSHSMRKTLESRHSLIPELIWVWVCSLLMIFSWFNMTHPSRFRIINISSSTYSTRHQGQALPHRFELDCHWCLVHFDRKA